MAESCPSVVSASFLGATIHFLLATWWLGVLCPRGMQVQEQPRRIRDVLNVAHAVLHPMSDVPLALDHVRTSVLSFF